MVQHHLAVCPGEIEHTISKMAIPELVDKTGAIIAVFTGAGYKIKRHALPAQVKPGTDGRDRIKYRALASGQQASVFRSSRAAGLAAVLPRPMKRARSVYRKRNPHPPHALQASGT